MFSDISSPTTEELLTAPRFRRENFSSYLFAPFSRKLQRRVYVYTDTGYDLWVRLESNPKVVRFNERVPKVPVALCNGKATNASPQAISVDSEGIVTVHTIQNVEESAKAATNSGIETSAWKDWAKAHGYQHINWEISALRKNPIELANLDRLLRFASVAGAIPKAELEQALIAELRSVRKMTFAKLVEQFPQADQDEVHAAVATLIIDQKIYSDIDRFRFSMTSELSAYHVPSEA